MTEKKEEMKEKEEKLKENMSWKKNLAGITGKKI